MFRTDFLRRAASASLFLSIAGIAVVGVSTNADAAMVISSGATSGVVCASGICTPTKNNAVLNVSQLQSMLAVDDVTVTTAGAKAYDLIINAGFTWVSANTLTLDSYQSITINSPVVVAGTGGLTMLTADGGTGGQLSFGKKGNVDFWSLSSPLTINGHPYTLVPNISTLVQDSANNASNGIYGYFALTGNYNASSDGTYTNSPIAGTFRQFFEGLGNTISNLTIVISSSPQNVGLFASTGSAYGNLQAAVIENLHVENIHVTVHGAVFFVGGLTGVNSGPLFGDSVSGKISLSGNSVVGGLVGYNDGPVKNCRASADIVGRDTNTADDGPIVGGLIGTNLISVSNSFATGNLHLTGDAAGAIGGLAGSNGPGRIVNSYATGSVSAESTMAKVGGLVGQQSNNSGNSSIASSYSTSGITGAAGSSIGGFTGADPWPGDISNSYWDTTTSGVTNSSQGSGNPANDPGVTGVTTTQLQSGLPAGFDPSIWGENSKINKGLPYLLADPPG